MTQKRSEHVNKANVLRNINHITRDKYDSVKSLQKVLSRLRVPKERNKLLYWPLPIQLIQMNSETSSSNTRRIQKVPPGASSVAAVVRNGSSYSFSRRLRALSGLWAEIMSKQMVRRWCRQFSEGRQSVHDEERSGRPSLINDDPVELLRQCIMENRRFTITELSSHFPQISRSLLHEIVTKHLLFKKVCARWVSKNLTPEHKMQRLGAALTFLQRYHDDGDKFLDRIVTGDGTWISHFTSETSSSQCIGGIVDLRKGILLIDFLPRGETVNAMFAVFHSNGVVLLHDNARPRTARRKAAFLTEFGWELFEQPPYSPDLAPSDFHVFLHLKKFLSSGKRFGNDEELKTSVTRWFHSQAAEFYDRWIQKLIPRYDKCLNSDGGYVEK
ncbi:hypothetical protein ANN_01132 [Periplaneta americana]|uniref:Transposase n=1 Tax=Periplaneta americana TaxID=6978 RepID=A0ABQ8TSQ0_PERAM|nr:hypothetical protein ANN_01132 [Periplaneta americana]